MTRASVVIGLDLEDFFSSINASRIYGAFRIAGYPEAVAHHPRSRTLPRSDLTAG